MVQTVKDITVRKYKKLNQVLFYCETHISKTYFISSLLFTEVGNKWVSTLHSTFEERVEDLRGSVNSQWRDPDLYSIQSSKTFLNYRDFSS